MTVLIAVGCPHCHSTEVVKYGQSSNGKQRFRCLNGECLRLTFSLNLAYRGLKSEVKQQIGVDIAKILLANLEELSSFRSKGQKS